MLKGQEDLIDLSVWHFSKSAGLGGDYWGYKGLGSKLMLSCTKMVIETWTGLPTDLVL